MAYEALSGLGMTPITGFSKTLAAITGAKTSSTSSATPPIAIVGTSTKTPTTLTTAAKTLLSGAKTIGISVVPQTKQPATTPTPSIADDTAARDAAALELLEKINEKVAQAAAEEAVKTAAETAVNAGATPPMTDTYVEEMYYEEDQGFHLPLWGWIALGVGGTALVGGIAYAAIKK